MNILILNGPNLNLLGSREKTVYGNISFETYLQNLKQAFPKVTFNYFQSNIEGELIDQLHGTQAGGVILNAGGYTHTSVALRDAISAIKKPVVEVHISNIFAREDFRHVSLVGGVCLGSISGFGLNSYKLAVQSLLDFLKS